MITGVSMYRLMSSSLLGLLLLSLVLAAVGLIGFSPAGILTIALVAFASTALATLMFASVFRQVAHLESSLITGLLVAFILPPTVEVRDIIGAAAAGAIAGASKYLVAIRGRHFLNPAAVGSAVAVGLGLSSSFWWIANPPMTVAIVVVGAMVAWRSGLGAIAWVGLGVGAIALMARLLVVGEELWSSLYLVTTSYPLVFLTLFMLSEPLTSPPRAVQRLSVAAVVGLGVALPFSVPIGNFTFSSSPEIALLAGNLVALFATLMTRAPRTSTLTLANTTELGNYGAVVSFTLGQPLRFQAGQWIELYFPHARADRRGVRRVFSVCSAPHEALGEHPTLRIATRLSQPGSSFKSALVGAPMGSEAHVSNIGGDFVTPRDSTKPLLLLAGGVGITPFLSQLAHDTYQGIARDVVLVDVRRDPGEHWGDDVIRASGVTHLITTREHLGETLARITDVSGRWCAVSGPPGFVRSACAVLRRNGARSIATDSFTGY